MNTMTVVTMLTMLIVENTPTKRDKSGLSVMQLNIIGLLNKQENLKKST